MTMLKKLFSLCLALAVILSLAVPAMAEGEEPAEDVTFIITINPSQSNDNLDSHKDHKYEAYQVLSGKVAKDEEGRTVLKNPQWGQNFPVADLVTALQNDSTFGGTGALNIFSVLDPTNPESAEKFAEEISKESFNTTQEAKLAAIISQVITDHNSKAGLEESQKCKPVATTTQSGDATVYTLTVPAGFYMIKDQDGSLAGGENKDYTDIILHVSDNVNVYHKGSIPTVTKAVSERGTDYTDKIAVAIGTTYYYRLVGTLPDDFDKYSTYQYVFHDQLSPGMTFGGVVEAYIPRTATEKEILHLKDDTNHQHGYQVKRDETKNTVEIFFENLKHESNLHNITNNDKIVVVYRATLNENAVIGGAGNNNTACLVYSNNPNDTARLGRTNDNTTKTYTYAVNLNKYNGATPSQKLGGVKFVLYRENAVTTDSGEQKTTVLYKEYALVKLMNKTTDDEPNRYVITGWVRQNDPTSTEIPEGQTEIVTGKDGQAQIRGLSSRTDYYLKETHAVGAYHEIPDPIKIHLTATVDANGYVNTLTAAVTGSDCHVDEVNPNFKETRTDASGNSYQALVGVNLNIPNYLGAVLPSTGGIGTTVFYIVGAVLVLGAVVLLVTKKRMS